MLQGLCFPGNYAGANVRVLQTLLGHKTATLTLDRYGHLFATTWAAFRTPSMLPLKLLRALCGRFRHYGQPQPSKTHAELPIHCATSRTRTDTGRIVTPPLSTFVYRLRPPSPPAGFP